MSFGIKPTYKKRILVNRQDDDVVDTQSDDRISNNYVDTQKLVDTVLQVTRRSGGLNNLTQQELEHIIRKSSINPEYLPEMKETVDNMYQEKKQNDSKNKASKNTSVPTHGFSNSSTASNSAFLDLLDQELKRELGKLDTNTEEFIDEKQQEEYEEDIEGQLDEESEEDQLRRIEMNRTKQMVANGFPSRASMLRGWEPRKTGNSGGIRKTATGIVDGF